MLTGTRSKPKTQTKAKPANLPLKSAQAGVLPRKCDWEDSKQLSTTDLSSDSRMDFGHSFGRVQVHSHSTNTIQAKLNISQPGDVYEQEADRIAEQVSQSKLQPIALTSAKPLLQRALDDETGPVSQAKPATSLTAAEAAPAGLIVEDDTQDVSPGQMKKSIFLDQLQAAVCTAADAELASVGRNTQGCPYIEKWMGYYRTRSSTQVERSLRRYAPEAAGARNASDYIPIVVARVRRAVSVWASTGELTGVPEELRSQIEGGGLLGAVGGVLSGIGGAVAGAIGGIGRAIGGLFTKGRDGGTRETVNVEQIQGQLGKGQTLDSNVRGRMEGAFGYDFSQVRIHTDSRASELSSSLNARAFTIGSDVAFSAGEYKPGTMVGDALLAHELAHVVQQGGAVVSNQPLRQGGAEYHRLEEDADESAVGAVVSLWRGAKAGLSHIASNAMPRLKSGLKLQGCKSEREKEIERLGGIQYGFLEQKRKEEEEKKRKEAEEEAKKRGEVNPKIDVKVTMEDLMKEEGKKSGFTIHKTDAWDKDLTQAERDDFKNNRAPKAWQKVVESVKGMELENVLKGKTYRFEPREALEKGYYAYQDENALVFGMTFVKDVEAPGGAKNAWPVVAHELGGHFEYGTPYASEIMDAAISMMPKAEREKWQKDPEQRRLFYLRYSYPETEIFAALRELRYADPVSGPKPTYGGIHPYTNIPKRLKIMKDALEPEVAKAVLQELKRRIDKATEILDRDKKYFQEQVKLIFGYTL
ncbi:MAG: DUF4157 domain-containing protein [Acidobacteriota bacterium]